jgi:xylan 1,4-beta-xylosidase
MQQVDDDHGNALKTYIAMGSPRYPTRAQVQQMNAASALPPSEHLVLRDGTISLDLKPNELVLLHVDGASSTRSRPSSAHPRE